MAARIERHPEAFAGPARQKQPRKHNDAHLKWIRTLGCAICGSRKNVHAAHLRAPAMHLGKRSVGIQEKPDDAWTTPLCEEHHMFDQHAGNEMAFWEKHKIDPFMLALALFRASGDDAAAETIIRSARRAI